jgi:hypothetical protein
MTFLPRAPPTQISSVMTGRLRLLPLFLVWAMSAAWSIQLTPRPMGLLRAHMALLQQRQRASLPLANFGIELPQDDDDDDEYEDEETMKRRQELETVVVSERPATNMTVDELKSQLRVLGQRHTGTKAELIKRVQLAQRKQILGIPTNDLEVQKVEDMQWYMLQTANGFERSVERSINMAISSQRLQSKIDRVFVPIVSTQPSPREVAEGH